MFHGKTLIVLLGATVALSSSALAGSCSGSKTRSAKASMSMMTSQKDIVQTAAAAGSFDTLLAAAKAAGLVDALKGDGPLTVLAPTDEAFAKLPAGTVESLLRPENRERLAAILTYHVAPGRVPASDVIGLSRVPTLNGQRPDVTVSGDAVRIGGAKVVSTDIAASNGLIHVIDSVLIPSDDDIVKTAVSAGSFGSLATALQAADLVDALQGEGPFTVFAPTDSAFGQLPDGALENLLDEKNLQQLAKVLTLHVVPGRLYSDDILGGAALETLEGSKLDASRRGANVLISGAKLLTADIETSNGVIHVIDSVLMPGDRDGRRAALELIEGAISHGAPLYNHGQQAACTAIYEVTASALAAMPDDMVSASERGRIQRAMRDLSRTHGDSERAWAMRDALDDVAASIQRSM